MILLFQFWGSSSLMSCLCIVLTGLVKRQILRTPFWKKGLWNPCWTDKEILKVSDRKKGLSAGKMPISDNLVTKNYCLKYPQHFTTGRFCFLGSFIFLCLLIRFPHFDSPSWPNGWIQSFPGILKYFILVLADFEFSFIFQGLSEKTTETNNDIEQQDSPPTPKFFNKC